MGLHCAELATCSSGCFVPRMLLALLQASLCNDACSRRGVATPCWHHACITPSRLPPLSSLTRIAAVHVHRKASVALRVLVGTEHSGVLRQRRKLQGKPWSRGNVMVPQSSHGNLVLARGGLPPCVLHPCNAWHYKHQALSPTAACCQPAAHLGQAAPHLSRRALKQPPAAQGEERVACGWLVWAGGCESAASGAVGRTWRTALPAASD